MHHLLGPGDATKDCLGARPEQGLRLQRLDIGGGRTVHGTDAKQVALSKIHCAEGRADDPHRVGQQCLKHRLQLTRKCRDNAQTLEVAVCCSSDSEIVCALAQLIK